MSKAEAQLKSLPQLRAIFGLAKKRGLSLESLHILVEAETGQTSLAELTAAQANKVITALGGQPLSSNKSRAPRRTEQYRRQRTGAKKIVTPEQLNLITRLAAQRNWTAASLAKFCNRMIRRDKPASTHQANTIIEALKSMNAREGLWAGD